MAKSVGALSFVDGAQSVQHNPVNVQDIGCDFYAFSAHKLYGPMGLGVLYGRFDVLESLPPYQGGGAMIDTVSFDGTTYNVPPMRFEAGTPNVEAAVGLTAAIRWFTAIDPSERQRHENELTSATIDALEAIDGVKVYGAAASRVGIVSFTVDGVHASDIGTILDAMGIAVRVGHHCTQPLMRRLGVTSTVRASFAVTTTMQEIEALAAGVRKAVEMLR
jgi:cysteine desulfurase/selenocysteine lyase